MRSYLLILGVFAAASASADVKLVQPVRVTGGLAPWAEHVKRQAQALQAAGRFPSTGFAECAAVKELDDAFFCAYWDPTDQTSALLRASIYIEGIEKAPKGSLLALDDPRVVEQEGKIGGFDLRQADLLRFRAKIDRECSAARSRRDPHAAQICLSNTEKEFFDLIVKVLAEKQDEFVIITFTLQQKNRTSGNLEPAKFAKIASHEIKHAQYFLLPLYATQVDRFWEDEVIRADRDGVRTVFKDKADYDTQNEFLMRNEFQAFLLQDGDCPCIFAEDKDSLDPSTDRISRTYRSGLERAMREAGLTPIKTF